MGQKTDRAARKYHSHEFVRVTFLDLPLTITESTGKPTVVLYGGKRIDDSGLAYLDIEAVQVTEEVAKHVITMDSPYYYEGVFVEEEALTEINRLIAIPVSRVDFTRTETSGESKEGSLEEAKQDIESMETPTIKYKVNLSDGTERVSNVELDNKTLSDVSSVTDSSEFFSDEGEDQDDIPFEDLEIDIEDEGFECSHELMYYLYNYIMDQLQDEDTPSTIVVQLGYALEDAFAGELEELGRSSLFEALHHLGVVSDYDEARQYNHTPAELLRLAYMNALPSSSDIDWDQRVGFCANSTTEDPGDSEEDSVEDSVEDDSDGE